MTKNKLTKNDKQVLAAIYSIVLFLVLLAIAIG